MIYIDSPQMEMPVNCAECGRWVELNDTHRCDHNEAIRETLEDPEHEDWCDLRDAAMQGDGRACNCFLGPRTAALVAVLELHVVTDASGFYYESKPVRRCSACGFLPFGQRGECATKRTIAEKLGVTERDRP